MLRFAMTAFFFLFCSFASAGASERVYFVRDAEDPVVIGTKPNAGKGIMMRDPNLGSDEAKTTSTTLVVPKKHKTIVKVLPRKSSALAFKPMKIGGTMRMPRVEFGRVALPVSIREEEPSTDFIARSLDDLP